MPACTDGKNCIVGRKKLLPQSIETIAIAAIARPSLDQDMFQIIVMRLRTAPFLHSSFSCRQLY
jgi:hypothetical protein